MYIYPYVRKSFLLSNTVLLLFGIGLILLAAFCLWVYKQRATPSFRTHHIGMDKLVLILTAMLCLWQCYSAYNLFFSTGWDAGIIEENAKSIAGGHSFTHKSYFSFYPNNLFTTYFYALILKLNSVVGVFAGEYEMMSIVLLNCLINAFSCFLVYKTARLFASEKLAFIGYSLAVFSFGLSAWNVICYSDSLTLFAPILSFYLYAKPHSRMPVCRSISGLLAVAVSMVCYFIKPQCAIPTIAIILIEIVRVFDRFQPKKLIKPIALCLTVALTFVCVNGLLEVGNRKMQLTVDSEKKLGVTHFLMMGMNEKTCGVYSGDDVTFSHSFETAQARNAANLQEAKQRIQKMGPVGLSRHLVKKLIVTFHDGTFAWGVEGNFYRQKNQHVNGKASPFLQSLYYNGGKRYTYLSTAQQFIWLAILFLSFLSAATFKKRHLRKGLAALWLTILGVTLYEMLFEVRARYLYIFVPIFCVLAVIGIKNTLHILLRAFDALAKKLRKGVTKQ